MQQRFLGVGLLVLSTVLQAAAETCTAEAAVPAVAETSLLQVQKHEAPRSHTAAASVEEAEPFIGMAPEPAQTTPKPTEYGPHVCILARSCGPHSSCAPGPGSADAIVRAFLTSMVAQTYRSWELHLLNGEGGGEIFQNVMANLGDDRLVSGPSAPTKFAHNTWGYDATNLALDKLIVKASKAPCQYFLFTNADNLYARKFLEVGVPGMKKGSDLIGFNFVTRYVQGEPLKPETNRAMLPMKDPGFTKAHIDLGAVLVSAKAIKETGGRFDPRHNELADWRFFEKLMQRSNSQGHEFNQELQFIHQFLGMPQGNQTVSERI